MISLIVAMDRNRAIGKKGNLPWHLPADLARFKQITLGQSIIMGRKTFDSIGRPLPKRTNIVITRDDNWSASGVSRAENLESAIKFVSLDCRETFIIGGGQIFKEAIDLAHKLYVTEVEMEVCGADIFFPEVSKEVWIEVYREHHEHDEKNEFGYDFVIYERR